MKLVIEDPDSILELEFGYWLLNRFKDEFYHNVDRNKLKLWDKYLNSINISNNGLISAYKILKQGVDSLKVVKTPISLEIYMLKNAFVYGLNMVNLEVMCKLITYGNNEISGYSILLDLFKHFQENINYYIELYDKGV